jgi:hypothetical protein
MNTVDDRKLTVVGGCGVDGKTVFTYALSDRPGSTVAGVAAFRRPTSGGQAKAWVAMNTTVKAKIARR